jgi:hypothetical protein
MQSLRYVVLRHKGYGEPHFDLMFETSTGSELLTWRSPEWPPTPTTRMTYLAAHRREYLDYEGPVSGDRGSVRRIHQGEHVVQRNDPAKLVTQLQDGSVLELSKIGA